MLCIIGIIIIGSDSFTVPICYRNHMLFMRLYISEAFMPNIHLYEYTTQWLGEL